MLRRLIFGNYLISVHKILQDIFLDMWCFWKLNQLSASISLLYGKIKNNWATSQENLFMPYVNNKGADQPAHPHSLISILVVHSLDSMISLNFSVGSFMTLASFFSWADRFWVVPDRKPWRQVFSWLGSILFAFTSQEKASADQQRWSRESHRLQQVHNGHCHRRRQLSLPRHSLQIMWRRFQVLPSTETPPAFTYELPD